MVSDSRRLPYRRLFLSRPCARKPGPKGPDEALSLLVMCAWLSSPKA
jgi:hypothetical protein